MTESETLESILEPHHVAMLTPEARNLTRDNVNQFIESGGTPPDDLSADTIISLMRVAIDRYVNNQHPIPWEDLNQKAIQDLPIWQICGW